MGTGMRRRNLQPCSIGACDVEDLDVAVAEVEDLPGGRATGAEAGANNVVEVDVQEDEGYLPR